ncbi:DUF6907 domain-containing protein [Streptomyces sp. CA2R106]|uniref:DUF6907 domain-containing protein n=1 Tax=Streptomyces sp. CA2R106 TaxID=3120153 RepID=UPI0030082D32
MITTTTGERTTGYLPPWAAEDPSEQDLLPDEMAARLAGLGHVAEFPGPAGLEILRAGITFTPHAAAPEPAIPVATVWVADAYQIADLDPTGPAEIVQSLRSVADRLDHVAIPHLNDIRAAWTTHHTYRTGARP